MEKALIQHTEMLSDETYASKIKNEVDQHLIGMDCQLTSAVSYTHLTLPTILRV